MKPRVYLAGPEVFLPDPAAAAEAMKAVCAEYGLEGVFPIDGQLVMQRGESQAAFAARLRRANLDLIRSVHAVIANVSPFRGPSVDDGTAYEMGFAAALGLPVFAWTAEAGTLLERTLRRMKLDHDEPRHGTVTWRDPAGMVVEEFGLPVNLMLVDPDTGPVHGDFRGAVRAVADRLAASRMAAD